MALWREGLLARKVLRRLTKGYRRHPQLQRFQACSSPIKAIDAYLSRVWEEADARGYRFDASKIRRLKAPARMGVGRGQVAHEWRRLGLKLKRRDPARWKAWKAGKPSLHPSFRAVAGGIADWERA